MVTSVALCAPLYILDNATKAPQIQLNILIDKLLYLFSLKYGKVDKAIIPKAFIVCPEGKEKQSSNLTLIPG